MITHVLTALILSAGINSDLFTPATVPTATAVSADTGSDDTGASDDTGSSDDSGVMDTGTDTAAGNNNEGGNGNVSPDDTADTGSDAQSSGATYSASDLAGEKGGCSTAPSAPLHLAWLMLAVVGWRRRAIRA